MLVQPERQPAQARERDVGTLAANLPASEGGRIYEQPRRGLAREHAPERPFAPMWMYIGGKLDVTMGWAENDLLERDAVSRRRRRVSTGRCAITTRTRSRCGRRRRTRGGCIATNSTRAGPRPRTAASTRTRQRIATDGDLTGTLNGYFEWDPWRGLDDALGARREPAHAHDHAGPARRRTPARWTSPSPRETVPPAAMGAGHVHRVTTSRAACGSRRRARGDRRSRQAASRSREVKVFRYGSLLDLQRHDVSGVTRPCASRPGIALSRHPARVDATGHHVAGRGRGGGALYDVSGRRRCGCLWSGAAKGATQSLSLDTGTLPPGLYPDRRRGRRAPGLARVRSLLR